MKEVTFEQTLPPLELGLVRFASMCVVFDPIRLVRGVHNMGREVLIKIY